MPRQRHSVNITYNTPGENVRIPDFLSDTPAACDEYTSHFSAIRSFKMTNPDRVRHVYNFRLESGDILELEDRLYALFATLDNRFKINCSFGSLLQNIENGRYRYWHSSENNFLLFDKPSLITNENEYRAFVADLLDRDVNSVALLNRDNTKWKLRFVTNICIFVYRILDIPLGRSKKLLPSFVRTNKGMSHINAINGNLCIFECISLHFREKDPIVASRKLCEQFTTQPWTEYKGVKLNELSRIEKFFKIRINIYELERKESTFIATLVRRSTQNTSFPIMYINRYGSHLSFINNFNLYCRWLNCSICGHHFKCKRHIRLVQHEKKCSLKSKEFFPGGIYSPPKNLFKKLNDNGIRVPARLHMFPYRIFYDCESILYPTTDHRGATSHTNRHEIISIAYNSNVPGFTEVQCLVKGERESSYQFIGKVLKKLEKISRKSACLVLEYLEPYLASFERILKREHTHSKRYKRLCQLKNELVDYMKQIPTLGFNSKSYDLPLFLSELACYILDKEKKSPFIIKKNNKYIALVTEHLRFLDISNYLAPGISYSKYLRAFGCNEEKFFFPYEYLSSHEKLNDKCLPPHSAFFSSLKNCNITQDEYALCQHVWKKRNMKSLKDFLVYYNTLDVDPGMEAIDKHLKLLWRLGVDPLKETFTISGLAFLYLFKKKFAPFALFNNGEMFRSVKASMVGGPSIVYCRHAKVGETKIKPHRYGDEAKTVKSIVGFDANSLYLSVLNYPQLTGFMVERDETTSYNPRTVSSQSFKAICWIKYLEIKNACTYQYALHCGEVRVSSRNLPVDGYYVDENDVEHIAQFMGCFYHGHCCTVTRFSIDKKHPYRENMSFREVLASSLEQIDFLINDGYQVEVIWECEWDRISVHDKRAADVIKTETIRKSGFGRMKEREVVKAIQSERMFGLIECDISVPYNLREKFSEFTPIFKNEDVGIDDISEHMRSHCEKHALLKKKRRLLICSYSAKRMWFITPLAKWYLDHGLEITHVYRVIEFDQGRAFSEIVDEVIAYRRLGDSDEAFKLMGDVYKLIGNSIFGKSILAKEKMFNHLFCHENKADKYVRGHRFRNLEDIGHSVCEIEQSKRTINQNMPMTLGFGILNYAKRSLLSFYYDFIQKYLPDDTFCVLETDTDSLYLALSEKSLQECVPSHKRKPFFENISEWMPIKACRLHYRAFIDHHIESDGSPWEGGECCLDHYKHECRTPGKWKLEAEGDEMICLNSKTYILCDENTNSTKISTKGVSKSQNTFQISHFKNVLSSGRGVSGINRGIRVGRHKKITTYHQTRTALSYLYIKRKVLSDGCNTTPLLI